MDSGSDNEPNRKLERKKNVICNSQCACGVNRWGFFWPNKIRKVEKFKFWSSFSARDMKLTFYESIHWNHWGVEKKNDWLGIRIDVVFGYTFLCLAT